jgi:hypothetical protein
MGRADQCVRPAAQPILDGLHFPQQLVGRPTNLGLQRRSGSSLPWCLHGAVSYSCRLQRR